MLKKISTSEKLLSAAEEELIASDGQMEMAAVARRAGVSVGLAYHHFGSKNGLVAALVDRFYEPIRVIMLGDQIPVELEWAAREKARAKALIDYLYGHPLASLVAGRLAREPEVLDIERHHQATLLAEGARNIAQGQKLGAVNQELDPETTVAMLMGGMRLAIDQAILTKKRPEKAALLEQIWALCAGALNAKTE